MSDRTDDKPGAAQYPPTDRAEHEAVDVLNYILNERVKSHIDSRDKTPNHDGWLEIIDENDHPIGRINVQIKKLPDKHRDDPKIQINTKNLAYCFISNDPFIVILVDVVDEIAYWTHITESWYNTERLDKQSSKVVKPRESKWLTKTTDQYIDEWIRLIEYQDSSYFNLDKPPKGATNWSHRINQNFAQIDKIISELGSELGISGVGDYKQITEGQTNWHIPINENFEQIEIDIELLAKKLNIEQVGGYHQPQKGKRNWNVDLNHNFFKMEEDISKISKRLENPG